MHRTKTPSSATNRYPPRQIGAAGEARADQIKSPLDAGFTPEFYFDFDALGQRLKLLRNLINGRDAVILVIGERGSGKTSFLNRYLDCAQTAWKKCRIRAAQSGPEPRLTALTTLHNHTAYISQDTPLPIVIIDDAHLLQPWELKLLFKETVSTDEQPTNKRLLLLGESILNTNLTTLVDALHTETAVSRIFLPTMTLEETAGYLSQRLSAAGFSELMPLKKRIVKKLHRTAGGLPGRVNLAADLWLQKHAKGRRERPRGRIHAAAERLRRIFFITLALGAALTAAGLLSLHLADRSPRPSPALTAGKILRVRITEARIPRQTPVPQRIDGDRAASDQTILSTAALPVMTKTASTGAAAPDGTNKSPEAKLKAVGIAGANREDWLLKCNPSQYTIQIIGAHTEDALEAFLKKHPSAAQYPLACYRTLFKGKPWYPLLYGIFPTRIDALAAVDRLPPDLRVFSPWIRSIAVVQKTIRSGIPQ